MRHILALFYLFLTIVTGYMAMFSLMVFDSTQSPGIMALYLIFAAFCIPASFFIGAIALYAAEGNTRLTIVMVGPPAAFAHLLVFWIVASLFA